MNEKTTTTTADASERRGADRSPNSTSVLVFSLALTVAGASQFNLIPLLISAAVDTLGYSAIQQMRETMFCGCALGRQTVYRPPRGKHVKIRRMRTGYQFNPIGIDARVPRFSWQVQSETRGMTQSAYQIRIARERSALAGDQELVSDSGKVSCGASTFRPYHGPALQSRQRYYWQVRVWDSPCSELGVE